MDKIINKIKVDQLGDILENESLVKHTTMRVGGIAKVMYIPNSLSSLQTVIELLKESKIDYMAIGRGSNLIFIEEYVETFIIKVSNVLEDVEIKSEEVVVGAGLSLQKLAKKMSKLGYEGLEFAGGIPATVGGAIFMNAGAHTGEMADIIAWVEYLDENNELVRIDNEACKFTYRHSIFQDLNDIIIVRAGFKIFLGDKAAVFKKMSGNLAYRKEMQPLELPSCGSTFRNPPGNHAGKLIEDCGLKGFNIGGVKVSEKHANFVVNYNDGTAQDVVDLIKHVQDVVYTKTQIKLSTEIRIINEK